MPPAPPPPIPSSSAALSAAITASTETWQNELKTLFEQAKARYADIVWDIIDGEEQYSDEIWGHKAVVYARASSQLQARNLSPTTTSESPGSGSTMNPFPSQTFLSLLLPSVDSSSPLINNRTVLRRISLTGNPGIFKNLLEYLYTGQGESAKLESEFGIFAKNGQTESPEPIAEIARRDKLRRDLFYMWKFRLYSDVRIEITGNLSSINNEIAIPVISSHRFILSSRVPHFRASLFSPLTPVSPLTLVGQGISPTNPLLLDLPTPPFTPAALHFTLGFIYTGTLTFSDRTWDLETAFNIMRSAKYLGLDTLENEIRARIVAEMMHGLFHAYLPFDEYERVIEGKWGIGGCKCMQCQQSAPHVLEFALEDDVRDNVLERGAQRALAGMYGEGWATSEFLALPLRLKNLCLKGVKYRTLPHNIIPLLQATQTGLNRLSLTLEPPVEAVKDLMLQERKTIDKVLCNNLHNFLEQPEWVTLLESDDAAFDDFDKVDLILDSIGRGLTGHNAGLVYQLVSSVLLREGPIPGITLLSRKSLLRAKIERLRINIIAWMREHWTWIRISNCFDGLEGWALTEISDELDVLVEDLTSSSAPRTDTLTWCRSLDFPRQDGDDESLNIHSTVTGVKRNPGAGATQSGSEPLVSSQPIRSTASFHSAAVSPEPPTGVSNLITSPTRISPVTASSVRTSSVSSPRLEAPTARHIHPSESSLVDGLNLSADNDTRSSSVLTKQDEGAHYRTDHFVIPPSPSRPPTSPISGFQSMSVVRDDSKSRDPQINHTNSTSGFSAITMPDTLLGVAKSPSSHEQAKNKLTPLPNDTSQFNHTSQSDTVQNSLPDKMPGLEKFKESMLKGAPISRKMTAHEVIAQLVTHGCQDLTNNMDHATFGEHPISHGGFSDIYRGYLLNSTQVAIKILRISISTITGNPKHLKHAARELHTWGKCNHPNVLPLHGLAAFRGRIGMVSPWMEQGNLPRYLEQTPGLDRCNLCAQICDGLAYMHQIGIVRLVSQCVNRLTAFLDSWRLKRSQ
ncbi:hypothetical protein B0J17DRAFT_685204 [Rhizoctonia solani]|nr:hypothetical protein B0J17DRAFT_685204 [Rhizoctonia solani]